MISLHNNKAFVKSLVTFTRPIQIAVDFQFYYLVLILINTDRFHHAFMTSILSDRFYNDNLL